MKNLLLVIIVAFKLNLAYPQAQIKLDSISCLERIDSKTFEIIINRFVCQNIDTGGFEQFLKDDYILLLKISNTINWYQKDSTYGEYYLLRPIIMALSLKFNNELGFGGPGESGGVYSQEYNFWVGGLPRASSMFYINDWILLGPITKLFFDCECSYPPCNE